VNLLFVQSHQAKIIILKRLIQGRNHDLNQDHDKIMTAVKMALYPFGNAAIKICKSNIENNCCKINFTNMKLCFYKLLLLGCFNLNWKNYCNQSNDMIFIQRFMVSLQTLLVFPRFQSLARKTL